MNKQYINTEALWLVSWYPNVIAPFDGDFIQRHAKAVSLFKKVTVIHIRKDDDGLVTKGVTPVVSLSNNLTEIIIYYHPLKTGLGLIDKVLSAVKYRRTYRSAIKKYLSENGRPALVHVHVALKAGIEALWLKKIFNIPFIISEHWTGYLPGASPGLDHLSLVQKQLVRKIFSQAKKITVVSDVLGKAIVNHFGETNYTIVPNVVDTSVFFPEYPLKNTPVKFIHISSLEYQKNISAIIEAFALVRSRGYDFHLIIYGPQKTAVQQIVNKNGLHEVVQFEIEVPQSQLASQLRTCDALILYSHYETFGCVVIEANACGIPAILSNIPVFKEYIMENENGIFVTPNNPVRLAEKLQAFIAGKYIFDKKKIAEKTAEKFSYTIVGKQFYDLYQAVLLS